MLFFILGTDSLRELAMWYEPRRILELAGLLINRRNGFAPMSDKELRDALQLGDDFSLRQQMIDAPVIGISSRDIRKRIAEGRSVRYMIPRAVEAYIADKGLYR